MPAVPKKKSTRARTGKRRGLFTVKIPNLAPCPSCKKLKASHKACSYCGFYNKASK